MAGGGSPRQRMINLMYLVFISMMAMNMGKEVLSAFGLMNKKLEISNVRAQEISVLALEALERKAQERADAKDEFENAKKVKELSDKYVSYLDEVKGMLMVQAGEDKDDYQVMDKSDLLDEYFFAGDALTDKGKEFLGNYKNYAKEIIGMLGPKGAALEETIKKRFDSGDKDDKVLNREGQSLNWVNYNFEGFPYIAAVTKMSQIQADVRQTEQDFYAAMLGDQMKAEISMKNYTTLLEQSRGAYYQGQTFDGSIVLGRKDNSTRPSRVELSVDGRKLQQNEYEIGDGKIKLNTSTGGVGEHKIEGNLYYNQDGEEIAVQVKQTFTTIPRPNEAVISADKMNVVYRGVDNPMTISMPGVSDDKISASAPGLSKRSGSNYLMKPGQGKEVTISVTGTIEGEKFSSSKKFRIKDLPKPEGAILRTTGAAKLPKANIGVGEISVMYEDFDFDLTTRVTSFRILVPGQPSVVVQGNKVSSNPAASAAVNRARKGDIIQISDIRYSVSGYNGTPKPATPISIEVQ